MRRDKSVCVQFSSVNMASQEEHNKLESISNVNKDQERYYLNVYKVKIWKFSASRLISYSYLACVLWIYCVVLISHGGHIRCRITSENMKEIRPVKFKNVWSCYRHSKIVECLLNVYRTRYRVPWTASNSICELVCLIAWVSRWVLKLWILFVWAL